MLLDVAAALTAMGPGGELFLVLLIGVPLVLLAAYLTSDAARTTRAARAEVRETSDIDG